MYVSYLWHPFATAPAGYMDTESLLLQIFQIKSCRVYPGSRRRGNCREELRKSCSGTQRPELDPPNSNWNSNTNSNSNGPTQAQPILPSHAVKQTNSRVGVAGRGSAGSFGHCCTLYIVRCTLFVCVFWRWNWRRFPSNLHRGLLLARFIPGAATLPATTRRPLSHRLAQYAHWIFYAQRTRRKLQLCQFVGITRNGQLMDLIAGCVMWSEPEIVIVVYFISDVNNACVTAICTLHLLKYLCWCIFNELQLQMKCARKLRQLNEIRGKCVNCLIDFYEAIKQIFHLKSSLKLFKL